MTDENKAKMREALEYGKSLSERENGPRCSVTEQFDEALALLATEPSEPAKNFRDLANKARDIFEEEEYVNIIGERIATLLQSSFEAWRKEDRQCVREECAERAKGLKKKYGTPVGSPSEHGWNMAIDAAVAAIMGKED